MENRKISQQEVNQWFIKVIDYLKREGLIKSDKEFADKIGISAVHLSDIKNKGKNATSEMIANLFLAFANINWVEDETKLIKISLEQQKDVQLAVSLQKELQANKKLFEMKLKAKEAELEATREELKQALQKISGHLGYDNSK